MTLVGEGAPQHFPAEAAEVFDVSGAGDTVVATLAAGPGRRARPVGRGPPVQHRGGHRGGQDRHGRRAAKATCWPPCRRKAKRAAQGGHPGAGGGARRSAGGSAAGASASPTAASTCCTPATSTCWNKPAARCDRLVVGAELRQPACSASKGASRPVQSEAARAAVLGSIAAVDLVCIYRRGHAGASCCTPCSGRTCSMKGADYTHRHGGGGRVRAGLWRPGDTGGDLLPGHLHLCHDGATSRRLTRNALLHGKPGRRGLDVAIAHPVKSGGLHAGRPHALRRA